MAASVRATGAAFVDILGLTGSLRGVMAGHASSCRVVEAFADGATRRGRHGDRQHLHGRLRRAAPWTAGAASPRPATRPVPTASRWRGGAPCRPGSARAAADPGHRRLAGRREICRGRAPRAGRAGRLPLPALARDPERHPPEVMVDAGNGRRRSRHHRSRGMPCWTRCRWRCAPVPSWTAPFPAARPTRWSPPTWWTCRRPCGGAGADIGLAFDGDADRCFVVDQDGEPSASAVAAIVAEREIAGPGRGRGAAAVIHDLITWKAMPELIEANGGRAVRTRVGRSFIKAVMASEHAVFGGERSAHSCKRTSTTRTPGY
ncbi:hypothetical protein QJS66_17420 [Kocuria rhizophila]|nr:hypothetical protein QJS66_17420 [Kocuria rhizophila]